MTRALLAVVAMLALLLTAACGNEPATGSPDTVRLPSFAAPEITWAQGTTLHYGERTFAMPGDVQLLWRTPYGFLATVRRSRNPDAVAETIFFDGRRTVAVPGEPADITVSPDGRFAGWIDFDGPKRPLGRLAVATVVDLRTGRTVLRNHDDMGAVTDDLPDLYEDAEVHFLGFDERFAYWDTPTGKIQRRRAAIGSWQVEPAARATGDGFEEDLGHPYDSLVGQPDDVRDDGGQLFPTREGLTGFRSPDRRWCLTDGQFARLWVDTCQKTTDVTPDYPHQGVRFGGWQDADTFYVLSSPRVRTAVDPGRRDPTTGEIASCTLPSGDCRTVVAVNRTESVVFATGQEAWAG